MGNLTREPEIRYSAGESSMAIARFSIAVNRRFKRQNDQADADFFNCTAFGKTGEFVEKYLRKGTKVVIDGEVQNDNYEKDGVKHYGTQIIINQIEFAESKKVAEGSAPAGTSADAPAPAPAGDEFMNIPEGDDENMPW
jgi:single-strand DNA-binding protein